MDSHKLSFPLDVKSKVEIVLDADTNSKEETKETKKRKVRLVDVFSGVKQKKKK